MKSIIALFAVLGFVSIANAEEHTTAPAAETAAAPAAAEHAPAHEEHHAEHKDHKGHGAAKDKMAAHGKAKKKGKHDHAEGEAHH